MPVRLLGAVVLTAWTAAATLAGDPAPSAQAVEPEGGPIALTPDQCADGFNDSPLGWSPA